MSETLKERITVRVVSTHDDVRVITVQHDEGERALAVSGWDAAQAVAAMLGAPASYISNLHGYVLYSPQGDGRVYLGTKIHWFADCAFITRVKDKSPTILAGTVAALMPSCRHCNNALRNGRKQVRVV